MRSLYWAAPPTPCRCTRAHPSAHAHCSSSLTRLPQDSAIEHARSLGMPDELIVRAMICACFKHPLHSTAILRRTCLGCSCASSVMTECFDSALLPLARLLAARLA